MNEETEVKGTFRYQQDSKRYHRFEILTDAGVVGNLYVRKDLKPMPKVSRLEYAADGEQSR